MIGAALNNGEKAFSCLFESLDILARMVEGDICRFQILQDDLAEDFVCGLEVGFGAAPEEEGDQEGGGEGEGEGGGQGGDDGAAAAPTVSALGGGDGACLDGMAVKPEAEVVGQVVG